MIGRRISLGSEDRITLIYLTVASTWILLSDTLLHILLGPDPELVSSLSMVKGLVFVFVTTTILYFYLQREFDRRFQTETHLESLIQEAKRTEDLLRQSENQVKTLVENSTDFIVRFDRELRHDYVNGALSRATGIPIEDYIGKTNNELGMPEEQVQFWDAETLKVFETGETNVIEFGYTTIDGYRHFHAKLTPEFNHKGEITTVLSIVRDITENKRVEHDLIESESRYRTLFENMNAGFVLFEIVQDGQGIPVDLVIVAANEGFATTTGLNLEEVIGKQLTKVLPGIENDVADWIGTYGKIALTGEAQQFEQSSELLGIDYSISAFQPRPKRCAVTFTNITERNKAVEALRKNEENYRTLVEHASDGIFVSDSQGYYVEVNTRGCNLLGYARDELIGKHLSELVAPANLQSQPLQLDSLKAGKSLISERHLIQKSGSFLPVEISSTMLPDGNLLGMVRDITERRKAEEQLQQQSTRLRILHEIDRAILSSKSVREMAQVTMNKIRELLPIVYSSVVTFDFDSKQVHKIAVNTENETIIPEDSYSSFPPDSSFFDKLKSNRVIVYENLSEIAHISPNLQGLAEEGLHSCILIPLRVQDELIGIFSIVLDSAISFTSNHIDIAYEVGTQLSVALHQSQLFDQIMTSKEKLTELSRQLITAQENERRRIARELHDELGQGLMILRLDLEMLQDQIESESHNHQRLADSIKLVDEVTAQMRYMAMELRPSLLDDLGLYSALRGYVERFQKRTSITVKLSILSQELRYEDKIETAIFRCVQEALTNAIRHAEAQHISINLEAQAEAIVITIEDDGIGFDPLVKPEIARIGGTGLSGMIERLGLLNGTVKIDSSPGTGTRIEARIPTLNVG